MSFDTNRFTQKSQEAIIAAQNAAERNGNGQVEPEHLLLALLDQRDGVVPQVLGKLNLGSEAWSAEGGARDEPEVRRYVLNALRATFRPEFLNRVDEVIIFRPLTRKQIGQIVEIQLGRLRKLMQDRKLELELTPAARERLADEGYDPVYGARPLKRVIQQRLQNPLALKLLQGEFKEGDAVQVSVNRHGELEFGKA